MSSLGRSDMGSVPHALSVMLCFGGLAAIGMMVEYEEDAGRELVDWPPVSLALFAAAVVMLIVAPG